MKIEKERKSLEGAVEPDPQSFLEHVLFFLRVPIERSNRPTPLWPIGSGAILTICLLTFFFMPTELTISEYGFSPQDPFKNGSLNIWLSALYQPSLGILILNLYFGYILSDDIEDDLGTIKFLGLIAFAAMTSIFGIWLGRSLDPTPVMGLGGVIMALFAYYALQFPRAKILWLFNSTRVLSQSGFQSSLRGNQWYQLNAFWIALVYLGIHFVTARVQTIFDTNYRFSHRILNFSDLQKK